MFGGYKNFFHFITFHLFLNFIVSGCGLKTNVTFSSSEFFIFQYL